MHLFLNETAVAASMMLPSRSQAARKWFHAWRFIIIASDNWSNNNAASI